MVLCSIGEEMFNIHKLIKSVKAGKLSLSSFNLRTVKKADQEGEESKEKTYLDTDWSEEAIQWRLKRYDAANVEEEVPVSPYAGPEPTVPTATSKSFQHIPLPEDMKRPSFNWVSNNEKDMQNLAKYPMEEMQEQLGTGAYLRAAPELWRLIGDDKLKHDALVSYTIETTGIKDVDKVTAFVDRFMASSEEVETGIGRASFRDKAEKEIKRKQEKKVEIKEQKIEKAKKEDPFSYPNKLKEPKDSLAKIFNDTWISSPPEQKQRAYDIIWGENKGKNEVNTPVLPSGPIEYLFGPMEDNRYVNQRINFFVKHPEHLMGVLKKNPELTKILKTRLPLRGMDVGTGTPSEIIRSMQNVKGNEEVAEKTKGYINNILTNTIGEDLYSLLAKLIANGHEDIYKWLGGPIRNPEKGREVNYSTTGTEGEVNALETLVSGEDEAIPALKQFDVFEQHQYSEALGHIGNDYIAPILEDSQGVMHGAMGSMISSTIDDLHNATTAEHKNEALERYSLGETINAFNIPMVEHLRRLFSQKSRRIGDAKGEDPLVSLFTDKYGKIGLPEKVAHDMLLPIDGESPEDKAISHEDVKGVIDRYIRRIRAGKVDPFLPAWRDMVSHNYPVKVFKSLGKLKEEIRLFAKDNNITPETYREKPELQIFDTIIKHFDKPLVDKNVKDPTPTLGEFAGSNETDPPAVRKKKIDDFIYMTLLQRPFHIKWLQKLGPRKEPKEGKVAKNNAPPHQNILTYVGDNYYKILGHLANKKDAAENIQESEALTDKMIHDPNFTPTPEESEIINRGYGYSEEDSAKSKDYTDGALGVIIGLLDHQPAMKNFLRQGSKINRADKKHRTNTELYYSLRGVEIPDYIKGMMEIHRLGISKSKQLDSKTQQPKLDTKSWYYQLFNEYEKFDPNIRGRVEAQERLKVKEDELDNHYRTWNNKLMNDRVYPGKLRAVARMVGKDGKMLGTEFRDRVGAIMEKWKRRNNVLSKLPDRVYGLLGYPGVVPGKNAILERKKEIEEGYTSKKGKYVKGIDDFDRNAIVIKKNLKEILLNNRDELAQHGMDIEELLPRLRLAYIAYNRALIKLAALEKMKKHNVKFASVNNVDYLDLQIAKTKAEFDDYFNSLFF
jgi:hypothetical protein